VPIINPPWLASYRTEGTQSEKEFRVLGFRTHESEDPCRESDRRERCIGRANGNPKQTRREQMRMGV